MNLIEPTYKTNIYKLLYIAAVCQTRYLVDHDPQLSVLQCVLAMLVQCLGFYIFRSANSEKDQFRKDADSPAVAHLTFLQVVSVQSLVQLLLLLAIN